MERFLQQLVKDAGEIAKGYFQEAGLKVRTKSHGNDYVTQADIETSRYIVETILDSYPDHAILSEELPDKINPGAQYEWVIDPIDGTSNFVAGIPFWCVSIAVVKDGEQYLGAIYNPISDDLFFAKQGEGAQLNGNPISVSNTEVLDSAMGVFVRANKSGIYGTFTSKYESALISIVNSSGAWLKNFGTVFGHCFVASGGLDFAAGNAGQDWDYLASFLICQEAGAHITDSDGNPWQRGRQDYIIANPTLHKELFKHFVPKMNG